MSQADVPVFIRRGTTVKGPVPFSHVRAMLQSGKLQPSDEVATSASGPWTPLQRAIRPNASDLPTIESFTIKRSMFGGGYIAYYQCLKCGESLQSSESEMLRVETCATCGTRYRLSPRAAAQAEDAKAEHEKRRAMAAATAQRERERKAAERQEAAVRRDEARQARIDQERRTQAAIKAAEEHAVLRATRVRQGKGICWYCGVPLAPAIPQCRFCHMLPLSPGSRLAANNLWNGG